MTLVAKNINYKYQLSIISSFPMRYSLVINVKQFQNSSFVIHDSCRTNISVHFSLMHYLLAIIVKTVRLVIHESCRKNIPVHMSVSIGVFLLIFFACCVCTFFFSIKFTIFFRDDIVPAWRRPLGDPCHHSSRSTHQINIMCQSIQRQRGHRHLLLVYCRGHVVVGPKDTTMHQGETLACGALLSCLSTSYWS